eukprot:m.3741 g.3741  ORF g.3741 m.3741 type:complete len:57 (-) comp2119_c0_seq2:43-213(-)
MVLLDHQTNDLKADWNVRVADNIVSGEAPWFPFPLFSAYNNNQTNFPPATSITLQS